MQQRLKIFTWHTHGSYLYYLSQGNYDIYIPVDETKDEGYGGKGTFAFGNNVHEVHVTDVPQLEMDIILFQSSKNYLVDQHILFSPEQHALPKIYLEHDPPQGTPTDTRHVVDDPSITIVHVTHFNNLMWNNNHTPSRVIDHGVIDPGVNYSGEIEKGIVVINNIAKRGRGLGLDVFQEMRKHVPLVIAGMGSKEVGGVGEIPLSELPAYMARHRFFFNPIRYTSLGLTVCEAMMTGMPIIGMATTEMPTVIRNGVSGFLHTDLNYLMQKMKLLLHDRELAKELGKGARQTALERFTIARFTGEWEQLFAWVMTQKTSFRFAMAHV